MPGMKRYCKEYIDVCRKIPIICSSLNRLLFMFCSFF